MGFIQHLFDVLGKVTKAQQHRLGRSGVFCMIQMMFAPPRKYCLRRGDFFIISQDDEWKPQCSPLRPQGTKRQNSPTTRTPEGGR